MLTLEPDGGFSGADGREDSEFTVPFDRAGFQPTPLFGPKVQCFSGPIYRFDDQIAAFANALASRVAL